MCMSCICYTAACGPKGHGSGLPTCIGVCVFFFCFGSFISNPLHGAHRAMAAAPSWDSGGLY